MTMLATRFIEVLQITLKVLKSNAFVSFLETGSKLGTFLP